MWFLSEACLVEQCFSLPVILAPHHQFHLPGLANNDLFIHVIHIMSNLLRQLFSIFPVKASFFLQILQMNNSFSYKCLPVRQHS